MEIGTVSPSELYQAQGTCIHYVERSLRTNRSLRAAFLNKLKAGSDGVRSSFILSLGIGLLSDPGLKDKVLPPLKSSILNAFKEEARAFRSNWLRTVLGDTTWKPQADLLEIVKSSIKGCEPLAVELVNLCDCFLSLVAQRKSPDRALTRLSQMATTVTGAVVRRMPEMAGPILVDLRRRLTTKKGELKFHVDLVRVLATSSPLALLESSSSLKSLFEVLPLIQPETALSTLRALLPLLKVSRALKNNVIVRLRKALASPHDGERKVALNGFLLMLRHFKVFGLVSSFTQTQAGGGGLLTQRSSASGLLTSRQSSQSMSSTYSTSQSAVLVDIHVRSQGSSGNPAQTNRTLCLDLLEILCHRTGDTDRSRLYRAYKDAFKVGLIFLASLKGLCRVVERNPEMAIPISSIFVNHLNQRWLTSRDGSLPPLKFDDAVKTPAAAMAAPTLDQRADPSCTVFITEPLGELLVLLFTCLDFLKNSSSSGNEPLSHIDVSDEFALCQAKVDCLEKSLTRIRDEMLLCSLDDLGMVPGSNYHSRTPQSNGKILKCHLVLGVYEALIQGVWGIHAGDRKRECVEKVIQLFEKWEMVNAFLKQATVLAGPTKGEAAAAGKGCNFSGREADSSSVALLDDRPEFALLLLTSCAETLSQPYHEDDTQLYACASIAKSLLHHSRLMYADDGVNTQSEGALEKEEQSLRVFEKVLIRIRDVSRAKEFFKAMGCTPSAVLGILRRIGAHLWLSRSAMKQKSLIPLLGAMDLLITVSGDIPDAENAGDRSESSKACEWIHDLADKKDLSDATSAKLGLSHLLMWLHDSGSVPSERNAAPVEEADALKAIAHRFYLIFGDINESTDQSSRGSSLTLISDINASSLLLTYVDHLEQQVLVDVALVIGKIKEASSAAVYLPLCHQLCPRLGVMVSCLAGLLSSSIPNMETIDRTLALTTHAFTVLKDLVLAYISHYKHKRGQMCPRFERLVSYVGRRLSPLVCRSLTYVQGFLAEEAEVVDPSKKKPEQRLKKAMKESRRIPSLVYAVELYDQKLSNLRTRSRIHLEGCQQTTSRDFRILKDKLAEVAVAEEEGEAADTGQKRKGTVNERPIRVKRRPPVLAFPMRVKRRLVLVLQRPILAFPLRVKRRPPVLAFPLRVKRRPPVLAFIKRVKQRLPSNIVAAFNRKFKVDPLRVIEIGRMDRLCATGMRNAPFADVIWMPYTINELPNW
ncbi:unnamed protein product [Cyprideis torosa]|uniref:Uncharacterized protein n=1 Tax=Cyprideis torosa TaxID=163714 RepID=A0A7R8WBV6_9CRUS|nr:unnamed protein product [Cyprideis torosa]CAG0886863.1 unnamed protein product [Cyprideis torosa]